MKNIVNLDKALAEIRNYPGARIDRKVFKVVADHANDKGVATSSLCTIADAIKTRRDTVRASVCRLVYRGLMDAEIDQGISPSWTRYGTPYSYAIFTIKPAYMLRTTGDGDADDTGDVKISAYNRAISEYNRACSTYNGIVNAYNRHFTDAMSAYAKDLSELSKQLDKVKQSIKETTDKIN